MSMNGLKQFITTVRQSKDSSDESKKIDKELKHIYEQFRNYTKVSSSTRLSNYHRRKYICKLMYIQLSGYDILPEDMKNTESLVRLGIEQCLILLNAQLSNYTDDSNKDEGIADDVTSNLKELKNDRDIGFLGLKDLYNEHISIHDFESIVNSVLIDISSTIVLKNEKNKNVMESLWIIVGIGLQSVSELIIWVKNLSIKEPFLREFVSSVFELIHLESMKVPEFVSTRAMLCIAQLFKLDHPRDLKNEVLTWDNLAFVGKTLAKKGLKDTNMLISLCTLLERWVVFDWEGIKSLEGLLITKLTEVSEIVRSIEFENNKNNIQSFDWVLQYGHTIIALFNVLSHITTVAHGMGAATRPDLKNTVDKIISNCVGNKAKLLTDNTTDNTQNQLIVTSVLFAALNLYINDVNNDGKLDPGDVSTVMEALVTFLQFNNDANVRISCLKKLILVMEKSSDYGYGRKVLLAEATIWRKFMHEKDLYVCKLTVRVLILATDKDIRASDAIALHQIKDVMAILMYYLQKCENTERGTVLSSILTILDNYKDTGIIQDVSRKLLKIFVLIGNCDDEAWAKVYELIIFTTKTSDKNHLDLAQVAIDFIVKSLSIGCCENFIKLSCLVFRHNCEYWGLGDLDAQLSLLIDKYENSTLFTKLLILDTMDAYYDVVTDVKLKRIIKLAFEQEMQCNNIEIKQRAHEYYTIIKLDLALDKKVGLSNFETLPPLTISSKSSSSLPLPSPLILPSDLSDKWEEGYIRLLWFDQGILYDSANIRITFRVKRDKKLSQIDFNYKLKTENTEGFESKIVEANGAQDLYDLEVAESKTSLANESKNGTLTVRCSIKKMYPENKEPVIQFKIPSTKEEINLRLSLAMKLLHTSEGNPMSIQTFQSRWNQIGQFMPEKGSYKLDISTTSSSTGDNVTHMVELIVRSMRKMNFEVITAEGGTSREGEEGFVITCASILGLEDHPVGCLAVLTAFSVEVRCTDVGIVEGMCKRIAAVLRNIN